MWRRLGNPYVLLTIILVIGLASSIGQTAISANGKTEQFGPFESGSPDSGTCGNDWADDEYDLSFKVRENNDGTFTVRVEYKNGTFVTREGPSPGACQDESEDGTPAGSLVAGIKGKMHGYLIAEVDGERNPDADCGDSGENCEPRPDFFEEFFLPGADVQITKWAFHYSAFGTENQKLVEHEWKNADESVGGNHGDIATSQP
jgi:hypothetical protein